MPDRLWSPWRSDYIEEATTRPSHDDDRSIFAKLTAEENDEENLILWRGEDVFVIMNRHPYNNGHLLVLPYRQVTRYEELTPGEQAALAHAIERCIRWLRRALAPDGFNVGMNLGAAAGAGVPEHLHAHVLPRWSGDTNFMPATAEVKVIPEALQATYRKLRNVVEATEDG